MRNLIKEIRDVMFMHKVFTTYYISFCGCTFGSHKSFHNLLASLPLLYADCDMYPSYNMELNLSNLGGKPFELRMYVGGNFCEFEYKLDTYISIRSEIITISTCNYVN